MKKTFYDIHMHALNLSHPNLSAMLLRDDIRNFFAGLLAANKLELAALGFGANTSPVISAWLIKRLLNDAKKKPLIRAANCLSFFEIPMEYQFLVLEYFLKNGEPQILHDKKQVVIGDTAYDKIALCPLVIDFGYKSSSKSVYYKLSPKRPIANQVGDLLYAIRTYYRFDLIVEGDKISLSQDYGVSKKRKQEKLFDIFPFMGLDTRNYSLEEIRGLLEKYFREFSADDTPAARKQRLLKKTGRLDSNMYGDPSDYAALFWALGGMLVTGLTVLTAMIRRLKVDQVLKLGED